MINWERVNELREDIGADDFGEVTEIFLAEVVEVLGELQFCADTTEIAEKLHFLKGSALNLGFQEFCALCAQYEAGAENMALSEIPVAEIRASFERTHAAFLAGL